MYDNSQQNKRKTKLERIKLQHSCKSFKLEPEKTFKLESVRIISGTLHLNLHAFFRVRILIEKDFTASVTIPQTLARRISDPALFSFLKWQMIKLLNVLPFNSLLLLFLIYIAIMAFPKLRIQLASVLSPYCRQGRFAGKTSTLEQQKCDADDVKSVQNLVRSSDWSTQ